MIFTDQTGRRIELPELPERIVSTVPSQTELLYSLGLADRITGQTIFCKHPMDRFKAATKIGGTKKLNLKKIESLHPDLILANKEENDREQIETLSQHFPVWISDISDVGDALRMIRAVGKMTGTEKTARLLIRRIGYHRKQLNVPKQKRLKVIYLIWREPWMAAGRDTYIHSMLEECGWENLITGNRYPEISLSDMAALDPDLILLSSEPYPFKERHVSEINSHFSRKVAIPVNGEWFSWYGSRMESSFRSLRKFLTEPGYSLQGT